MISLMDNPACADRIEIDCLKQSITEETCRIEREYNKSTKKKIAEIYKKRGGEHKLRSKVYLFSYFMYKHIENKSYEKTAGGSQTTIG